MHIGFFTPEFPTKNKASGGLASHLAMIVRELQKQGHAIDVFVLDIAASKRSSLTEYGARVHHVPITNSSFLRTILLYTRAFCKKLGGVSEGPLMYLLSGYVLAREARDYEERYPFDIIHTSNLETTALFLPKNLKKKVSLRVSSKRDMWAREVGRWGPRAWLVNKIEEYMVRKTPRVYASSIFLKDLHERAGGRLALIRDPIDPNIYNSDKEVQLPFSLPSRYFVHAAGNLGHRKGTDVLIEALPRIHRVCPDVNVVFVGKFPQEEKEKLLDTYADDSRIHILGPQPRPVILTLFNSALAAVLPSTADTLPYTAIESLACKTPVIGTFHSSIDELVTPDKNGVLIPQGDPDALAKAMVDIWKNGFVFSDDHEGILTEMKPETVAQNIIDFATN